MNALAVVHDWAPRVVVHDEAVHLSGPPQHVPASQARAVPSYAGVDDMLADARARLERISARAAFQELVAVGSGALLVDIRPAAQRAVEGEVAPWLPVLVVERNVLEWRFDPRSDAALPEAAFDRRVIVLCQEGYTSSLAADSLQRLGIARATDVVGGFAAWRAAGMPERDAALPPAGPAA